MEKLFAGNGDLPAQMRAKDWAQTPLGPTENWPQSLKTVVRLLLTSRFAMWMGWGPNLTFLCNDAYAPTLGIKQTWALGAPAKEVWEEIWTDISPRIDTVMTTGQATWDEGLMLFLERSGFPEETYHTFSYSPIPDDAGGIGGMLCVVTEETERLIGERRLSALRQLDMQLAACKTETDVAAAIGRSMNAEGKDLPFALVYLFDGDGEARLACCSGFACESVDGLDPAALSSLWPSDRIRASTSPILVENIGSLLKNGAAFPKGSWQKPPACAALVPIAGQSQDAAAGFMVAGLNPYRHYDGHYAGFLNLMAGQISASLSNARAYEHERRRAEALAEIDKAKTDFFSNVSHEFRTPLTLMLGPLEEALRRTPPGADERVELATVHRNGLRLLRMVNSLLDFSRVEAGRLRAAYEPTDLAAFTEGLTSTFRSACDRAGLTLEFISKPLADPVYVDRDMWEKIVLNLISNAFKFTFEGGITVSIAQEGSEAVLRVTDTGTGIPEKEMPHIFDRFHRVDGAQGRTYEGTGIGLALVRELVKLHGGSVSVQSTLGSGTSFTVRIPFGSGHLTKETVRRRPDEAPSAKMSDAFVSEALRWLSDEPVHETAVQEDDMELPVERAARPLILVADDNADMRDYMRRLLAPHYEVRSVADGRQALHAARRLHPDLVLTDVMMPSLDGFGLLAALREDAQLRETPIIVVSARAGQEATTEGLEAGADDYLVKPFSARELLARVKINLEMAHVRRQSKLREKELLSRLEAVIAHLPVGVGVIDAEGRFTLKNPVMNRFIQDGILPSRSETAFAQWQGRNPDGSPIGREGLPGARALRGEDVLPGEEFLYRGDDGKQLWTRVAAVPIRAEDGTLSGAVTVVHDIDDLKKTEEGLRALINELNHRVKNTLATVQSIVSQTLRDTQAEKSLQDNIESRLIALSNAHNLLTSTHWRGASLKNVISNAFHGLAKPDAVARRVSLDGPPVDLDPKQSLSLAPAMRELADNAVKFGALSNPGGRVAIIWRLSDAENGRIVLRWEESGGPEVAAAIKKGYGSRLIERGLAHELGAIVRLQHRQAGVVCEIDFPAMQERVNDG